MILVIKNVNQLLTYYQCVRYLLRILQYPANDTYNILKRFLHKNYNAKLLFGKLKKAKIERTKKCKNPVVIALVLSVLDLRSGFKCFFVQFSYVNSPMCYEDLSETINPHYKPKISEESS